MNPRGYFYPPPLGPNPFISFVQPPPRPPPHPFNPYNAPNPYTFGFPHMAMPQDYNQLPQPMTPLNPMIPGNDNIQNFFQQASLMGMQPHIHQHAPPSVPLTVRSGVYDLRAVEEYMAKANSNATGSITDTSPQPLSVQPPPRGHFSTSIPNSTTNTSNGNTGINEMKAMNMGGDGSEVVTDDPTTYWLGIDTGTNEFSQKSSQNTSSRSNRRNKQNNTNTNNNTAINNNITDNNNTNNDNNTPHQTDFTLSPALTTNPIVPTAVTDPTALTDPTKNVDVLTSPPGLSGANNGFKKKSNHNNTGSNTGSNSGSPSSNSGDYTRNSNKNNNRHPNNRNVEKRRYVPKPNDATFKPEPFTPTQPDPNMLNLAKMLQESVVSPFSSPSLGSSSSTIDENMDALVDKIIDDGEEQIVSPSLGNESVSLKQRARARTFSLPRNELIQMISVDCRSVFEALQPPLTDLSTKLAFLSRLQRIVEGYWPNFHAKLHMFGSSANEMCFKNGDIDMCLTIDKGAGQEKHIVNKLSTLLERKGMVNVLALPHARVPIVKFKDPKSRFMCDICINNSLAVQNTRLVADYSRIDPRLRPLAYLVKYWAKRRGINNPYQGTLSSYAYINLVINFLQTRDPPILPCLQKLAANHPDRVIMDKFDCTYAKADDYIGFGEANTLSISELLCHFFHYYTNEYDMRDGVVSVRCGTVIAKREKGWDSVRLQRDHMLFAIEDPFETTHNLGRLVDKGGLHAINTELRRACVLLRNEGSFLTVCKERQAQSS